MYKGQIKKVLKGEQITIKINSQIFQNAIALEQHYFAKITKDVQAIKDIKVNYFEAIAYLTLQKFSVLVYKMQKCNNKYESYIAEWYYLLLKKDIFCDQFMKTFFQVIQDKKHVK